MNEKVFEGQYKDEKILMRTSPELLYVFLEKLPVFFVYILIILLCIVGAVFTSGFLQVVLIIFALIMFFAYGVYFWFMYTHSRYTITSRRVIYFVRKKIFKNAYREIHLVDLRNAIPKKSGFFGMLGGYGKLVLIDKDDKEINYSGLKEHKYVARYLGRVIDYIKINGHTDNLSAYQSKKVRAARKQTTH